MRTYPDPQLNEAVIPPTVLSGVVEIGQREACPTGLWFSGTGVAPANLVTAEPVKVSFRQAATILGRALRAMPDRPLGMQVGGRDALLTFGILGMAIRSCATAADALAVGLELHQASGSLVDMELEVTGQEFALRLHERLPEPELIAFLCEEVLCSTLALSRSIFEDDQTPTRVEFSYPAPPYVQEYRKFFRCPLHFGADANRMVFPASQLDRPIPTRNDQTRAAAVDTCRRLLDSGRGRPDIIMAVETLLSRNLRRPLTMAETARRLHITERTLRRQLTAAGERFSAVRDRVRQRRAALLLRESRLKIADVAAEVGFSDAREFRRAHIRWTGYPPSAERRDC
ncbi:AraC family transcriptional regulator [Streptomyces sp. MNU89]|uniref:AraC family transcriptional regulator n=1 Tax=Streptomyces sp. MNU89 TaxID=2560025 RepID=UPI001E54AEC3|nr:AraC family transcriptional regulator [Streptomyces sp. MNU89]MCC9741426.1 AraC family transcriptional regulator [Streptomyces sp. MNU89]